MIPVWGGGWVGVRAPQSRGHPSLGVTPAPPGKLTQCPGEDGQGRAEHQQGDAVPDDLEGMKEPLLWRGTALPQGLVSSPGLGKGLPWCWRPPKDPACAWGSARGRGTRGALA